MSIADRYSLKQNAAHCASLNTGAICDSMSFMFFVRTSSMQMLICSTFFCRWTVKSFAPVTTSYIILKTLVCRWFFSCPRLSLSTILLYWVRPAVRLLRMWTYYNSSGQHGASGFLPQFKKTVIPSFLWRLFWPAWIGLVEKRTFDSFLIFPDF